MLGPTLLAMLMARARKFGYRNGPTHTQVLSLWPSFSAYAGATWKRKVMTAFADFLYRWTSGMSKYWHTHMVPTFFFPAPTGLKVACVYQTKNHPSLLCLHFP